MADRIRVSYGRKITQQIGSDFDTVQVGGEWESDIPEGRSMEDAYAESYDRFKVVVEAFFEDRPKPVQPERKDTGSWGHSEMRESPHPRELPGEKLSGGGSEPMPVVEIEEGVHTEYENQKVWEVKPVQKTTNGKDYIVARVGLKGGPIPPKGYARVKSYNPFLINKIKGLREGDYVDIQGTFEGWDGREGRMYDFVPTAVELVRDVRTG